MSSEVEFLQQFCEKPLARQEAVFAYFGWAGILFRTPICILAFDIGEKSFSSLTILDSLTQLALSFHSHTHWDHYSLEVTKKLFVNTNASIITEQQVSTELQGVIPAEKLFSPPSGKTIQLNGFSITLVEGIHPRPISLAHVVWKESSLFHAADSGPVPLSDYPADIAFVPVGTPSPSCSPKKALQMVADIQPRVAIAMHGTKKQMVQFEKFAHKAFPEMTIILAEENIIHPLTLGE